jgi:hypothetical protein
MNTEIPAAGPDRLLFLAEHGLVARGAWKGTDADGREMLCALAALSAEVEEAEDPTACPASLCPEWMAYVVVAVDDGVSNEAHQRLILALGESARRWPNIDADAWERIRCAWLITVLDEAASHITVDEWGIREAIAQVQAALRGEGDLETARAAVDAAWVADAADAAADAAAWAAARAARAAEAAADAAAADAAADAAAAAAWAAADAAVAATWDRMTEALLRVIAEELKAK